MCMCHIYQKMLYGWRDEMKLTIVLASETYTRESTTGVDTSSLECDKRSRKSKTSYFTKNTCTRLSTQVHLFAVQLLNARVNQYPNSSTSFTSKLGEKYTKLQHGQKRSELHWSTEHSITCLDMPPYVTITPPCASCRRTSVPLRPLTQFSAKRGGGSAFTFSLFLK